MARRGLIAPTAVMVYAPRALAEVEIVLQVITVSYRFACGADPLARTAAASTAPGGRRP